MSPKLSQPQPEPFFMVFPWTKAAGMLFVLSLGVMLVYRLSQTGGAHVHRACFFAMLVAGAAGAAGLYAVGKSWGRDVYWVLTAVIIAAAIRVLIGGGGVAIITFFTSVHRSWFILFLGVYYIVFLAADTWLALWILRNSEIKDGEQRVHGNIWDLFS